MEPRGDPEITRIYNELHQLALRLDRWEEEQPPCMRKRLMPVHSHILHAEMMIRQEAPVMPRGVHSRYQGWPTPTPGRR